MKKLLYGVTIFVVLLSSARAALLISEPFEGPNNFDYFDGSKWVAISNFISPTFIQGDAKYQLAKETSGCHGGSQCIRIYGEYAGGTSEFWAQLPSPERQELWITWWEKLSSSYDINFGHKWFMVNGQVGSTYGDHNWQTWDGATNSNLSSRVYNEGIWACSTQTFVGTQGVTLPLNQWYQYKIHVKLNDSGQSNGFWEMWVKLNGTTWTKVFNVQNANNVRCGGFTQNINSLRFGGTRQNSSGLSSFGTKWIDDIKVGTVEADVDSGGGGSTSLAPPNNLRITN